MVHTAAQAQDFDVIAVLRTRQSKQGRREEHGLIIWVCYKQQNALVLQRRERRAQCAGVHPGAKQHEGHSGPSEPIHLEALSKKH